MLNILDLEGFQLMTVPRTVGDLVAKLCEVFLLENHYYRSSVLTCFDDLLHDGCI